MAFLDNSGDIILDAVLTDTGRMRLALGNGSFAITQFALGDDEIDYSLYNKTHASGTAYYDLEILQSPVLEAFTNNRSSLNSKLITISDTNLLYLPVMKINELAGPARHAVGAYVVMVDKDTEDSEGTAGGNYIYGENGSAQSNNYIRLDQGIDAAAVSPVHVLQSTLEETSYMVQVDNRFATIMDKTNSVAVPAPRFIDDDGIASYVFSKDSDTAFVTSNTDTSTSSNQIIAGSRGTILEFSLQASIDMNTGTSIFTELGSTEVASSTMGLQAASYYVDTNVTVVGLTTGYRIDIPVRFLKKQ
jgi:hypothetical protein